jgi:hypothetical protein
VAVLATEVFRIRKNGAIGTPGPHHELRQQW